MSQQPDEGFSLVEVIIAMFLLAVLALTVLPLIIGATRVSVVNKNLVAATSFANAQLAPIRDAYPVNPLTPRTCSSLAVFSANDVADLAGTGLTADVTIGACPTTYPGTVSVSVRVDDRTGTRLVSLPTRLLVAAP